MVLRILAVGCPRQAADRKVEAGRAELPLVVSVDAEVVDPGTGIMTADDVRDDPIDRGIAPPAPLVGERAGVAEAGQHQPVADPRDRVPVTAEPGDRADGTGRPDESIGVPRR